MAKVTKDKKGKSEVYDIRAYSFFFVAANPRVHGFAYISPEEMKSMSNEDICRTGTEKFCNTASKQAALLYCVSEGGLHHIHGILSSDYQIRLSTIKKFLGPSVHVEVTRGSKEEAEAYINKTGKYAEKGETILAKYQIGEIKGRQGKRTDFQVIKEYIDSGMTWTEIRRLDPRYYDSRYTTIIKNMYFDKRNADTPFKREVNVHWLTGESGSGKTGIIFELIKKYGESDVYLVSDYQNPFDGYAGEAVIILDEYRGQLPYATLLGMLEGYKKEIHCRYANVVGLWTEVYISTVKTPEAVYAKMIEKEDEKDDPIGQLLSRIADISYCYKVNRPSGTKTDRDGNKAEFYRHTISGKSYRDMKEKAGKSKLEQIKDYARSKYMSSYAMPGDIVEVFGILPEYPFS
ncbi:MAG: hypothetical protein LUC99_06395 [Clostridiales bacterium]|nr:hypothetical protein [Clostridiales bacterium]